MNKTRLSVLIVACLVSPLTLAKKPIKTNQLFQLSTINALKIGAYQGAWSYGQLRGHGDFGLGTFADLDGEMLAFNGQFYQINANGQVRRVSNKQTAPFTMLTFFKPRQHLKIKQTLSCKDLYTRLDSLRRSANIAQAIKITGQFLSLKTRSVHAQHLPYPPLSRAVAEQAAFEFTQLQATLVGFWLPPYLEGINSAGYHFHGLRADKKAGGHVLDCQVADVKIAIAPLRGFELALPDYFEQLNLNQPSDALQHP